MNDNHPQPVAIAVDALAAEREALDPPLVVDVRKAAAYDESARTIPDAHREDFEAVPSWGPALRGRRVVAVCVHGHEVSQLVAEQLRELRVDARYLEGGFEAWVEAGWPTADIDPHE